MDYDSRYDTNAHIQRVRDIMYRAITNLSRRATFHDSSKMDGVEKEGYDAVGQNLRKLTYGTPEYMAQFDHPKLRAALDHHFAHNTHHAEHFENGIAGMSLLDVVEMICDWKAASERHDDGDIIKSIEINIERYEISDQLASIIRNTAREMGWEK